MATGTREDRLTGPLLHLLPLLAVFMVILAYPFANMAYQGLLPPTDFATVTAGTLQGTPSRGLTLDNYLSTFTEPHLRSALFLSLGISALVAVASTVLCVAPAWLLVRGNLPGARLLRAILTIPLAFSGVIVGFLTVIMIGHAGAIPQLGLRLFDVPLFQGLAYSLTGLGLAYLWFEIPRATLALEAAFKRFDWELVGAARTLGASPIQAFRLVLLPLLAPAVLATTAITFAVSMGSFGVALLLLKKDSVLPVEIYDEIYARLAFEAAAAHAVVLAVLTLGISHTLRRMGASLQAARP